MSGFVSRELFDEKLGQLDANGAKDFAARGYHYAATLTRLLDSPGVKLKFTQPEALTYMERIIRSVVVCPIIMMSNGPGMAAILSHCEPYIYVGSPAGSRETMIGFPEGADTDPVPWPATTRATVLKATMAALHAQTFGGPPGKAVGAHVADRVAHALADEPAATRLQMELNVADADVSVADIQYACGLVVAQSLKELAKTAQPGRRQQMLTQRLQAARGMVAAKPDNAQGYLVQAVACLKAKQYETAVQAAETGIDVAQRVQDPWSGAFLRETLGTLLVAQAGERGWSVRVGRLRALLEEAKELMAKCKPWAPSQAAKMIANCPLAGYVKEACGKGDDEKMEYQRSCPAGSQARERAQKQIECESCGLVLIDVKRCGRCRCAAYCSQACQKQHWPQHKKECKAPQK